MGSFFLCIVVPVGVLVLILVVIGNAAADRRKAMEAAKSDYQVALTKLRREPQNNELREAALQAGRVYASRAREDNRRTMFDEVALLNDINAITANGTPSASAVAAPVGVSVEQRLQQLAGLRDKGLVTDAEYQERRQKILSEV